MLNVIKKTALIAIICTQSLAAAESPPGAGIATAHPLATRAGEIALEKGGNAFDAAIAITAALAVVEPYGSGLGGGAFWLLHRASDGKQIMVDARETAPALAHERIYQDDDGNIIKRASVDGPMAAGIPGIPAGIIHLASNYGRLPLKVSMAPAIAYANKGFVVSDLYRRLIAFRRDVMINYPAAATIFLQDGGVPDEDYKLVQKDLARSISLLVEKGRDGFYTGEFAENMVQDVRAHGGIWSTEDLTGYRVVERQPIRIKYKGITLVSAPPPSSGGIVLGQAMRILDNFDIHSMPALERKHYVIEAMRRAYRDRAVYLGDPDHYDVPVTRLLDKDYLDGLAVSINPRKATPSVELSDTPGLAQAGTQTTHFSVIDSEGNRVAGTMSINLMFGSGFVPDGTGILLNNEMDDFSSKHNTPNAYGLIGFDANSIQPGKRPLSSMSPTFIESEDRIGILGTPGGSRIISMVLLSTLAFIDGASAEEMVSLPRYHHQYMPDVVKFENGGFSHDEELALIRMGHRLESSSRQYGNMHVVIWDKKGNKMDAASDPRASGHASVIPD
jgi:gamma-glutamyltranspeptidase/glutathione hydrolase